MTCLQYSIVIAAALVAFAWSSETTEPNDSDAQHYWRAEVGDICQLPNFARPASNTKQYLECIRQSEASAGRADLGVWVLSECIAGYEFVVTAKRCKSRRTIRRQQAACNSNPGQYSFCPQPPQFQVSIVATQQPAEQCPCPSYQAQGSSCSCQTPPVYRPQPQCPCPQPGPQPQPCPRVCPAPPRPQPCPCPPTRPGPCPATCQPRPPPPQRCPTARPVQCAQVNEPCSWMTDPLARDCSSAKHFLQCQPAPYNIACGRWRQMPCEWDLIFDVQMQVCVWDPNQEPGQLPPAEPGNIVPDVATMRPYNLTPRPGPSPGGGCPGGCIVGIQIGVCTQSRQCPGQSSCQTQRTPQGGVCGTCCYTKKH